MRARETLHAVLSWKRVGYFCALFCVRSSGWTAGLSFKSGSLAFYKSGIPQLYDRAVAFIVVRFCCECVTNVSLRASMYLSLQGEVL